MMAGGRGTDPSGSVTGPGAVPAVEVPGGRERPRITPPGTMRNSGELVTITTGAAVAAAVAAPACAYAPGLNTGRANTCRCWTGAAGPGARLIVGTIEGGSGGGPGCGGGPAGGPAGVLRGGGGCEGGALALPAPPRSLRLAAWAGGG